MYICSVLLYRCYLSVYSPFFFSFADAHSVVCLMPVCGEVGLKPCASCAFLTQTGVSLLQITWTTDNQMYKMCLVSNRPATSSSSTLGMITQKSLVTALVSLGLRERTTCSDTIEFGTNSTACSLCLDTKKKKSVSRGTGSTFDISQHERRVSPS